jgi:uncharacterized protein VirK/YbjX
MNLSKKFTTLFLTLALVVGTSITAFATPNDDTITALKNAKVPATYIIQAENYLKTNTLTADQSVAIVAQITEAGNVLKASGITDLTKLNDADRDKILQNVVAAGNSIGLAMNATKQSNGQFSIVAVNAGGESVLNLTSNQVKQTGLDNTIIYVGGLMILLAAGSALILRKKYSFAT